MKKLLMLIPLVLLCCFTIGCQEGGEVAEEPVFAQTEEERINLKTLQLWSNEVWLKGKLELVGQLVSPEYIRHEPTGNRVVTPDQYAEEIKKNQKSFESGVMKSNVNIISAKDDLVCAMWSVVSTDPKVGNKGSMRGIQVYRLVDGKLAETWFSGTNDQGPWPNLD